MLDLVYPLFLLIVSVVNLVVADRIIKSYCRHSHNKTKRKILRPRLIFDTSLCFCFNVMIIVFFLSEFSIPYAFFVGIFINLVIFYLMYRLVFKKRVKPITKQYVLNRTKIEYYQNFSYLYDYRRYLEQYNIVILKMFHEFFIYL